MAKSAAKLTPMMQRYMEVKEQNPGAVLLFRMGDFFELFHDDARIAAKVLGLNLTSRDKNSPNPVPMAGFPHHSLEGYLQKLIRAGHRAAICDQVEDPKLAKGLVKREVTRIVTPGTLTDDALLEPSENNYLASLSFDKDSIGLSWIDVSTGDFLVTNLQENAVADEVARIAPTEILYADTHRDSLLVRSIQASSKALMTDRPAWEFSQQRGLETLHEHFQVKTLEGFGLEEDDSHISAAGALLTYLQETQRANLGHITRIRVQSNDAILNIDEATRRSLELTRTIREGKRDGSLIAVIDHTKTPMGARLLTTWLASPSTDIEEINSRLDAVEEVLTDVSLRNSLREQLEKAYDLKRLTARVATGRCSPRDLSCLTQTLALLPKLKALLSQRKSDRLNSLEESLDLCEEIRSDIETALVDEPPVISSDGGMIREGFSSELDELRKLSRGGKEWIAAYQAKEAERIGIPNLKVGYNKVFGYYLEVTAAQKDKVPEDYIRKQTLKNQERYITPELKEHEEHVLKADDNALRMELELFQQLRERLVLEVRRLLKTSDVLAEVDVLSGLAHLASRAGYCRPEITTEPILDIREGRHPVLDVLMETGHFVPNDVRLGNGQGTVQIITGPNMAGKSTYIRQAALLTVLAQTGSFVPASEARIGISDRIFARVGASDELGKGQSTFMVEMTETARILNTATEQSLIILDEIGRGTSTYDGLSLAWAVTEFLHDDIKARTLFATHYHELTELTTMLKGARNWNVAVHEDKGDVIFLHKITEGSANKSYGIHVAKLAGIPKAVLRRAEEVLTTLENEHIDESGRPKVPARKTASSRKQLTLFEKPEHPVLDKLRGLDVDHMTPIDALVKLQEIRNQVDSKK